MIKIIKGESKVITLKLKLKNADGSLDPFDLTGVTALDVCFKNQDDSTLTKSLGSGVTVVNAGGGIATVTLSTAETALLLEANNQSYEADAVVGGETTIFQFIEQLDVVAQIC